MHTKEAELWTKIHLALLANPNYSQLDNKELLKITDKIFVETEKQKEKIASGLSVDRGQSIVVTEINGIGVTLAQKLKETLNIVYVLISINLFRLFFFFFH